MGIRIHHLAGAASGKVQAFDQGPITIGRRPGSHVALHAKRDLSASTDHAVIERAGDGWVYRDLGSSNGSWLRGERVGEVQLKGGEEIALGKGGPLLCVEVDGVGAASVPRTEMAPPEQAMAAASGGKGPGTKTVGMMIQAALAQSRSGGRAPTVSFIRAVAGEAVRHGSRGFKVAVITVILILTGAVGYLVFELYRTRTAMREISQAKLGPAEIGEQIATVNRGNIYLLLYRTSLGFEQGFCTGFAVGAAQLLTNAHCVAQMQKLASEGATFHAALNEGHGARYPVVSWASHGGYDPKSDRPSVDVGLVTVHGQMPSMVPLAGPEQLAALQPGSQIFVYGFPGDLSDVRSPVATLTGGVVGRLTGFDGLAAAPDRQHLLQYSAFTSKGTSGSPVFDKHGRVVAVNSGFYQGKSRVQIEHQATGKTEVANVSRDLSGYAFGIRIDLAREMTR